MYSHVSWHAGQYQGQDVAVKVTYPYYEAEGGNCKETRVLQEVWAYRQLQNIPEVYGNLVPELLAFVGLPKYTFILVMTRQGQSLSDHMDVHGQIPSKDTLLAALAKLHSCGVAHGSPRFDNIALKTWFFRCVFHRPATSQDQRPPVENFMERSYIQGVC